MKVINILGAVVLTVILALTAYAEENCEAVYGNGDNLFTLATGSPGELGLLEKLANEFNSVNGATMCWIKAGSGKSLKLLQEKKVDLVLVHAPAAEKKARAESQAISGNYGKELYGKSMYDEAAYAKQYVHERG